MKKALFTWMLCLSATVLVSVKTNAQTLLHYWNFNNLSSPFSGGVSPTLFTPIKADYSLIDTNKAEIRYQLQAGTSAAYATYYDVNGGDGLNLKLGATAGNSLRLRNPCDSMEVRFYMPTTLHKNIKMTFEAEASSATNGSKHQVFDYSLDSGATWHNTGMAITSANGASTTIDSITGSWTLVTITFDTTVNNNNRFVARIKFLGTDTTTAGNDRIDNVSLEGDTLGAPTVVVPTPIHYWHFNTLASNFATGVDPSTLPAIKADFSMIDTNKAKIVYQTVPGTPATYVSYYDATTGDILNARLGAAAGNSLRLRNRSDSMQMCIYAPTTAHKNIVLTFESEASSVSQGAKNQVFDYSLDSGATWHNTGMIINGDTTTADTITNAWTKVVVAFDSTVNDNSRFVVRMKFLNGATSTTMGNDRIDNVTIDGDTLIIVTPPPPPAGVIHYWNFNSASNANATVTLPNIDPVHADFSLIDVMKANIVYQPQAGASASYLTYRDFYQTSAADSDTHNERNGDPAGYAIRFRNPCDSMEVRFYIPSTGYDNIVVKFETEASSAGNGAKNQAFDYSVDSGAHWMTKGMSRTMDTVGTAFTLQSIYFDSTANNKSGLVLRMKFLGTDTTTSGNDRVDNVTVENDSVAYVPEAVPNVYAAAKTITLYPNPATNSVYINTPAASEKTVIVYNVAGQTVYNSTASNKMITVPVAVLKTGMYYVVIHENTTGENYTAKFVKE